MGEERIKKLINKYSAPYVKGERVSSEYNCKLKREQRLHKKHLLCNELINEFEFLHLSPTQKDFVHYLIDCFHNDFKYLHGRAKNETIILAFIFYVKKLEDSRINLNNYSISQKYNLDDSVFKLVVCRMCDTFIKSSYLKYKDTTRYDHDILSKNGGQIY